MSVTLTLQLTNQVRRKGILPPDAKRPDRVEGANLLVIHPCRSYYSYYQHTITTLLPVLVIHPLLVSSIVCW